MKIKNLIGIFAIAFLFASCMFTEELYVNNDGSGKYIFKMDMSKMMTSMSGLNANDSLKEPEKLDTIIYFKEVLEKNKDSISKLPQKDQDLLKALKDFTIHMQVDEEADIMFMDFGLDFKELSDLKNMEEKISKIQALNENKENEEPVPSKADVTYLLKGNTFKRNVVLKDLTDEKLKEIDKSIEQSSSFFEGSMYKIIYHFESEIQHISFKNALISDDKKTLTIEVPMDSLMKNPKLLGFEVKLKQ